jgi:hypothetical protein
MPAQTTFQFRDFVNLIITTTNQLVTVLVVGMLVLFMWGLIRFIYNSSDGKKREQGKQFMLWGGLALFVAASLWGIIGLMCQTFLGTACLK